MANQPAGFKEVAREIADLLAGSGKFNVRPWAQLSGDQRKALQGVISDLSKKFKITRTTGGTDRQKQP